MSKTKQTITAIQLSYDENTGQYTIVVGIKEGEAAHTYFVPREHAIAFHGALQTALSFAREA